MPRVRWTPLAQADLFEIHDYIGTANHSPAAADHLTDAIEAKCETYARQPELGELRPDLGKSLRIFCVGNYVVVYKPVEDGIEVMRVLHGRRDYPSMFR